MNPYPGKYLESCRVTSGPMASSKDYGFNGAFFVDHPTLFGQRFKIVCSDGEGWEHVSVSLPDRCPTWDEMCYIKSLFWGPHEAVIQIHPPQDDYVNNANFCLHLWRPVNQVLPLPPSCLVGIKELGVLS